MILKAHFLAGSDYTSEMGTKTGALQWSPDEYITNFGEENMTTCDMRNAEKYFVKVYKSTGKTETFNELRTEQYVEKSSSLLTVAPTSSAIYGHLKRCLYVLRLNMNLLHDFNEDPRHFGWTEEDGLLIPEKCQSVIPEYFTVRCGCVTKCSKRCRCIKHETIFTEFCS